jgi:hypothetical protein
MRKWWMKTLGAGLLGAVLGLFVGGAITLSLWYPSSSNNFVHDLLYAGSPALGAGTAAGVVGTRRLIPTLIPTLMSIVVSLLVTGALVAAIRLNLVDLTGIEPVVVVVAASMGAAVGVWIARQFSSEQVTG